MAAAVGFRLMRRFSNVTEEWADTGVYSVAGMVTLAGALVSLTPLVALGETTPVLGNIAAFAVPVLYAIFAAHAYRALADRSHSRTLSAHWFALALALFLLGMGLLGALQAAPSVGVWTLGTRLTDLQITLTALAPAAMSLGAANQAAAELRGQNRRVTGLTPFWLVSFGLIGGALALGAAGVAQALTERRLGLGYLDVQALVEPLYALWVVGLLLVALGAAIYALTFWLRRPEIRSS
jgi:nitric oxide reductase subunit B